jgi:hypothetical protein
MIPEFWVWLLTTCGALAAFAFYGVATLKYRLGDQALEILALGVPFRTIPYAEIHSVHLGGSLLNEHWVTFQLANRVTLSLRGGQRRTIVITPADPEAFLRDLRSRLQATPMGHRQPTPANGQVPDPRI